MHIFLQHRDGISRSVEADGLTFETICSVAGLSRSKYTIWLTGKLWDPMNQVMIDVTLNNQNSLNGALHLHKSFKSLVNDSLTINCKVNRKKKTGVVSLKIVSRNN